MTTNSFALSRAIKLLSFPRFSLWSPSRCLTKPRFSLWSPSHHCHQASLFYPITKPLFESPSLCLCRFTLTHLQIRFTVTELCFSLRSPSRCPQASLFSPITKLLSESPSLCLCLCQFTEASSVSQIKSKSKSKQFTRWVLIHFVFVFLFSFCKNRWIQLVFVFGFWSKTCCWCLADSF